MADATGHPDGTTRETATLAVVEPAIARTAVHSSGRVGAVAYPYRIIDASVRMERPFVGDRTDSFVVSVDRARRLALRADTVPDVTERSIDDVLVVPPALDDEHADERARKSVLEWTLRRYSLADAPDISLEETIDAYKLFWLAARPDGDVIVDSVRGTERPLAE
jgi:hypothetical protein